MEDLKKLRDRVSDLEAILGSFMAQSERNVIEFRTFKDEMKDFKDEMKVFKNEMRVFKDEMKIFKDEIKDFKDGMEEFKDEMKAFKDDTLEERKRMNREWGQLGNRLGTLAEDLATPGLKGLLKNHFHQEFSSFSVRLTRKNQADPPEYKEFDAIAITDQFFAVCEVKTVSRQKYVDEYVELIRSGEIFSFFPEYRHLTLLPVFAGLSLEENVIRQLTRNRIVALVVGMDHMEVVNQEVVAHYLR